MFVVAVVALVVVLVVVLAVVVLAVVVVVAFAHPLAFIKVLCEEIYREN